MSCHDNHNYVPREGCDQCPDHCPDFVIGRYSNHPPFKVSVSDCDGPFDLKDLVLEASMWANGRLKKTICPIDTYFSLADNIGYEQMMVGDIIQMDRPRLPEKMLVIGFDEERSLVEVQRGYQGTTAQTWKRGAKLRIMKFIGASAQTEMIYQDVIQVDGNKKREHTESFLVYNWNPNDTCLAGCYYLEFKLIKMVDIPEHHHHHHHHHKRFIPEGVGQPIPYNAYGPVPGGTVYGPYGPYQLEGQDNDIGTYGIHGTDNPPVAPLPHHKTRDERVLEEEYKRIDKHPNPHTYDNNEYKDLGNSANTPLYPEPLDPKAVHANKQFDDPEGTQFLLDNHWQHPSNCVPSFTPSTLTPESYGCGLGDGVQWLRKFPVEGSGFYILISESPIPDI